MNRPIKFRAFNTKTKKMYQVRSLHNLHSQVNIHADLCNDEKGEDAVISNHYTENVHQNDFVYMQFTGFKDKEGKEIYEGDIVKSKVSNIHQIHWDEDRWGCDTSELHEMIYFGIRIIGNIYENPELIPED